MAYYDQPTFGSILDIIEQEAEISVFRLLIMTIFSRANRFDQGN